MHSKDFILIHGSWHNAWNWYRIKPLLENEGHRVHAIDLPGMGRDKTPIEQVKFQTTIHLLCEYISALDGKIILVGHSKNGVIISQIAEYIPDKIEKLIYMAALLIPNQKCAKDFFSLDDDEVLGPYIHQDYITNSSSLDPIIYKEGLYHDCKDSIVEMAKLLLSREPNESASARISISQENFGSVPRYYIECTDDRAITPFLQRKMYEEMPCEKVYSMKSSHSPFFSQPEELAYILNNIANIEL